MRKYKRVLASLLAVLAVSTNAFNYAICPVAEDSPPVDFISDWANYGGSVLEGYILSNYTSLGQSGWAVEAMKLGVVEGYKNVSWAIQNYSNSNVSISYDSIANTLFGSGIVIIDSSHCVCTVSGNNNSISYYTSPFEFRTYSAVGRMYTISGSEANTIYCSGGAPYFCFVRADNSSLSVQYNLSSLTAGRGNYDNDTPFIKLFKSSNYIPTYVTTGKTFTEIPVGSDSTAGSVNVYSPMLALYSTFQTLPFAGSVSDWSNPQNAIDALNNYVAEKYPDYVDENPIPDFDLGSVTLPGFVLPPDLPLETFPMIEMPTVPPTVLENVTSGISFHFKLLEQIVEKFNIQWLVILMLILGLFFMIFAR